MTSENGTRSLRRCTSQRSEREEQDRRGMTLDQSAAAEVAG